MKLSLPIRTKNPNNKREHWRVVAARAKAHRAAALLAIRPKWAWFRDSEPGLIDAGISVVLTRVGPRELDSDGNVASLKPVRDGVADALGLKTDADPRVSWLYRQARGDYAVEVEIRRRSSCPTCGAFS